MAGVHAIADLLAWFGWYVIPFIVILSLIVAVHELGHYFVGRWCGVKIDAFSLGFGYELFAWVDSRGTRWRIGRGDHRCSEERDRTEEKRRGQSPTPFACFGANGGLPGICGTSKMALRGHDILLVRSIGCRQLFEGLLHNAQTAGEVGQTCSCFRIDARPRILGCLPTCMLFR